MEIDDILPRIERLSTQDTWGKEATLLVKYHRALEQCEEDVDGLLSQVSHLEDKYEELENSDSENELKYHQELVQILYPALEALVEESKEMYEAEVDELNKKFKK